jgi:hypothetical protein
MSDERNVERILAYVRSNAKQYDLTVLRETLLAAGYSPIDLDEAFARFQGAPAEIAATETESQETTVETVALAAETRDRRPETAGSSDETRNGGRPGDSDGVQEVKLHTPDPVSQPGGQEMIPAHSALQGASDVSGPVDVESEIQRCLTYLQRYQREHALPSLRQQLLHAGQPNYVVDEALRRLQGSSVVRASVDEAPPPAWPLGFLVLVGNIFLIGLSSIPLLFTGSDGLWATFFAPILLLVEVALGFAWRKGPRALFGRTLLYGALYTLSIVVFGVIAAVLLVLFGILFYFRDLSGSVV